MSAPSSSNSSPTVLPLHHPGQEAKVVLPQAPLASNGGNVATEHTITMNSAMGAGQKALLQKRLAPGHPSMVSPTDNMMSPCTAKLAGTKKKNFVKGKPFALAGSFAAAASNPEDGDENAAPARRTAATRMMEF